MLLYSLYKSVVELEFYTLRQSVKNTTKSYFRAAFKTCLPGKLIIKLILSRNAPVY
jgi:hypothetical protein